MFRIPIKRRRRRYAIDTALNGEYWSDSEPTVTVKISHGVQASVQTTDKAVQTTMSSPEFEIAVLKRDFARINQDLDEIFLANESLNRRLQASQDDMKLLLTPSNRWRQEIPEVFDRRVARAMADYNI